MIILINSDIQEGYLLLLKTINPFLYKIDDISRIKWAFQCMAFVYSRACVHGYNQKNI